MKNIILFLIILIPFYSYSSNFDLRVISFQSNDELSSDITEFAALHNITVESNMNYTMPGYLQKTKITLSIPSEKSLEFATFISQLKNKYGFQILSPYQVEKWNKMFPEELSFLHLPVTNFVSNFDIEKMHVEIMYKPQVKSKLSKTVFAGSKRFQKSYNFKVYSDRAGLILNVDTIKPQKIREVLKDQMLESGVLEEEAFKLQASYDLYESFPDLFMHHISLSYQGKTYIVLRLNQKHILENGYLVTEHAQISSDILNNPLGILKGFDYMALVEVQVSGLKIIKLYSVPFYINYHDDSFFIFIQDYITRYILVDGYKILSANKCYNYFNQN